MPLLRITAVILSVSLLLTAAGWSQETPGRQTFSGKAVTFDDSFPTPVPEPGLGPQATAPVLAPTGSGSDGQLGDVRLRDEYLQLIKQKSELMDERTLKREIEATQRNISELLALQKLQDAERLLLSITTDFPESEAARQAQRMLNAAADQASQAAYPENQPGLNTAAEETPFRRSSATRELPSLDDSLPTAPRPRLAPVREFSPAPLTEPELSVPQQ